MDRVTSTLLDRLRQSQPGIYSFIRDCSLTKPTRIVEFIESSDVKARVAAFDKVALIILSEVLDEIRTSSEKQSRHLEAASWDLVADRIKDALSERLRATD